ncbi:MAG: cupin [Phycisphaeraceae bacterium]|nr:cupin [Phycisphaeraceae bacterium]
MSYFHDTCELAAFSPEKMKKTNLYESPRMFCDLYCLEPGQSQKVHRHEGNDKIYHVLSGRCAVTVGEETRSLDPGHTAVAPSGIDHGVVNESKERVTLLVVMAPHPSYG